MSDYIIRRMTLSDVDAVHAIEAAAFPMPWSRDSFVKEMTENKTARYLVAQSGDEVIGYAGAWLILDEGHITNVAVREGFRGGGIGMALVRALQQYAANLGVGYMTLEVRRSNAVAIHVYESLGFIRLGVRKRYYEDNGEDALLMVCQDMPPADPDFVEPETAAE